MPLKNQLHQNKLLSNVSVQYKSEELFWDKIFPMVQVKNDTDLYRVYDRNFKIPESTRAPKGVAKEFSLEWSTSSYSLEQHALKDYVGEDEKQNDDLGSLQVDVTESLTEAIYRRLELSVAQLMTSTSWSLNVSLAAGAAFNANTTTSDPVPVFDTGASTMIANGGKKPNYAVIKRDIMIPIKNHVSILDRVKYTSSEVTESMIGALIGIPEILSPAAAYDTAANGIAPSMSNFYDDHAFMGWKPKSAGMRQPSAGYMFVSRQPRVRTWFDNERNADGVEVEVKYQAKVVASLCGYLIKDCI